MVKAHFGVSIDNIGPILAGGHLTGKVYATISKETKGSRLTVVFRGKESTKVRYTVSTGSGRDRKRETRYAYASRNIVDILLPTNEQFFSKNNGKIQPGKYILPFQFEIPASLPSSSHCSSYGGYFKIEYKIKAELQGSGIFQNYQTKYPLHVLGHPPPLQRTTFELQPVSSLVRLCGCYYRGTMTCGARLGSTTVTKGEAVEVSFSCRNHTTVAIEHVTAFLRQKVKWSANRHQDKVKGTIQTCRFTDHAGLEEKPKLLPRGDSVRLDQIDILKEMRTASHTQRLIIPSSAMSTYQGQLGSVYHEVCIVVTTGSFIDNPEIRIPIRIVEVSQATHLPSIEPVVTHLTPTAPPMEEEEIVLPSKPTAPTAEPEFKLPAEYNDTTVVIAEPIKVGRSAAVTGGLAIDIENEDSEEENVVATLDGAEPPSLQTLLKEMKASLADLDIIQRYANDPDCRHIFATMTPTNFGLIIAQVDSMFDEEDVAVAAADHIDSFSCQHVAVALRQANEFIRSQMLDRLLPFCKDFPTNEQVIKNVLTPWELTVTERAFQQEALSRKH